MNGTQVIHTELVSYRINPRKIWFPGLVVGGGVLVVAALLGLTVGGFSNFLHAYLAAFIFWFGISCGCISLTMLHHLTGGRWGDVIRPLLESGAKCLPLMAVLFIPIIAGMKQIYPWMQSEQLMSEAVRHQSHIWNNPTFFIIRAVIYFLVLAGMVFALLRKYRLRDEMAVQDPEHNSGVTFRVFSGPGIVIFGIIVSMALFDWGMSTQPGWYSTIYGLLGVVSQALSTLALMTIVLVLILRSHEASHGDGALSGHHWSLVGKNDWHDLGNLMFATTMLWGYMSLSQMLITYSGHLPAETIFYNFRSINGWQYVGGFLIALHFCLPFLLLLLRDIKRDPKKLVWVALFILIVRQLDLYYQVHPSYSEGFRFLQADNKTQEVLYKVDSAIGWHTFFNLLTPIGIGGLWIAFFAWNLKDRRVLPAPPQEEHHG
jgi:hypothetical protein